MLFADKRQLQNKLEVDLLHLRQKELDHFTVCCLTLASPAALIAGFAYSGIAEVTIPDTTHWATEALYYILTVAAMLFQIAATIRASLTALMGPALALRGKVGSMHRSVEAMEPCFRGAWRCFLAGMFCILMSTLLNIFQQSQYWGSATFVGAGIVIAAVEIYRDVNFVTKRFDIPASEVERGAFSRSEVTSMFKGDKAARSVTRDGTTSILIKAAEGGAERAPPPPPRPFSRLRSVQRLSFLTPRVALSLGAGSLRDRRTGSTTACTERARIDVPASAPGPAEPVVAARAAQAKSAVAAQAGTSERASGSECVKGRAAAASTPAAHRSGVSSFFAGPAHASAAAGAAHGARGSEEHEQHGDGQLSVVLTVRGGKRLRWQVPASTTVTQLHSQAEKFFAMEIDSLLDAHAAKFATPETEFVARQARVAGDERVAFFEVVPKDSSLSAPNSFPRMLWANLMGSGQI